MTVDGRRRRITSADVAREAGVSRTTVSYVLNGTPHQKIPEPTRQRVLDAVARLEYAPSAAARALVSGRSDVVLYLLPDWPIGAAVGAMLELVSATLATEGLTLLAHPRPSGARPHTEVWRTIGPAAVVSWDPITEDERTAMRAAGVQATVVLLGGPGTSPGELDIPQQRIGRMQAEHLAAAGHRRLGYALPDDPRVQTFSETRLNGVRTACAELGLEKPVVRTVPLDAEAAATAVRAWREGPDPVTAVCAYNDDVALAVLAGLRREGLSAPTDLAVIGVDDVPTARLADPPLTTVTIDLRAITSHIAAAVVRGLAGEAPPLRPGSDIVHVLRRESA